MNIQKIALDKGHNRGRDQGAIAIGNENAMNIATGDLVIAKLKSLGYDVLDVISQISNDVSVGESLGARVSIANNWGADLYVSIHANACPGGTGCEVWCGSSSTVDIATRICNNISSSFGYRNRGVKIQGQNGYEHLYVLQNTNMPALLVEQCFVDDAENMTQWDANKMSDAIVLGIAGKLPTQTSAKPVVPVQPQVPTYEETVPTGDNIYQIPNMPFYIERRTDGDMAIHLDRGNYFVIRKGGSPEVYWNNNKGSAGSKRLF